MVKDTYIRIRLTEADKETIKKAAYNRKTNMSDYVLSAIYERIVKEDDRHDGKCKDC